MKIEMLNAHYVVIFCVGLMLVFMKDNQYNLVNHPIEE